MENNKRLIVIEGFDRSGKDTLMKDLYQLNIKNTYIYFNDLEGLPSYNKEQDNFLDWLNKFISKQIQTLNNLFDNYDTIIMTRLLISDEVYSKLFHREQTCIKYIFDLRQDVDIINYCILFKDYQEYVQRLNNINDDDIQYNEQEFDKINQLYSDISLYYHSFVHYIYSNTKQEEILDEFLNIFKLNNYDRE